MFSQIAFSSLATFVTLAAAQSIIQSSNLGCPSSNAGEHCVDLALDVYTLGVINQASGQARRCSEYDSSSGEGKVQCVFLDGDVTQFYCDNQKNASMVATFGSQSYFEQAKSGNMNAYWDSQQSVGAPQKYNQRYSSVKGDVLHVLC